MVTHLSCLPRHARNVRTGINLVDAEGHIVENYDTIFRELFCVAAACLADRMHEKLVDVGSLWNEMFATGGAPIRSSVEESESERMGSSGSDLKTKQEQEDMAEKGMAYRTHQTHGSLMLLVRRLDNNRAADKLEAVGYRFAELRQVVPIIGSTMQIRTNRLEEKLRFMSAHTEPTMLDPGVHVGFFTLRGRSDELGYDVLVRDQAHNLLPSVGMPLDRLEASHAKFLRHMDGQSLAAICQYLKEDDFDHSETNARGFAALFQDAIQDLRAALPDPIFDEAKLVSKAVQVPCASPRDSSRPATCCLITFTLILPPKTVVKSSRHRFIPLQFLKTQQLVYQNSPHRAAFARSVHREILPVLSSVPPTPTRVPLSSSGRRTAPPRSHRWSRLKRFRRPLASRSTLDSNNLVSASGEHIASTPSNHSMSSMQLDTIHSGDSDMPFDPAGAKSQFEDSTMGAGSYTPRKLALQQSSLGGIMISSEVTVDVEEANDALPSPTPPLNEPPQIGGRTRSHTNLNLLRAKSQRAVLHREREITALPLDGQNVGPLGGTAQMTASYEQAIEMDDVSTVLGVGLSKVVVKKEGDAMTFVDELFAKCIDTPRRT